MRYNIGSSEKIWRVILGFLIILIAYYYKSWWGALGIIPIATGFIGFCPFYAMISISTCTEKRS